jgi:hypothetical protein
VKTFLSLTEQYWVIVNVAKKGIVGAIYFYDSDNFVLRDKQKIKNSNKKSSLPTPTALLPCYHNP